MIAKHSSVESIVFMEMLKGNSWIMSGDFTLSADTSSYFHIKTGNFDTIITDVVAMVDGAEVLLEGFSESTVSADGANITCCKGPPCELAGFTIFKIKAIDRWICAGRVERLSSVHWNSSLDNASHLGYLP